MSRAKILIVDDNVLNRNVLERYLKKDYETLSAESGEEMQMLLPDFKPDLILLVVMMPGIDGHEACRWLRSRPDSLNSTKVIMVSARAGAADVKQGLAAGADNYITKPFKLRLLAEAINEQLCS